MSRRELRSRRLKSERGVFSKEASQRWPSLLIKGLERVEVDFYEVRIEVFPERRDDFGEFLFRRCFGEFVDGAIFFMGNAETVEKGAQEFAMRAHEPDLEDLCSERIVGAHREVCGDMFELFGFGFSLEENWTEFAELRDGTNGSLVERFFVGVEVGEKGIQDGCGKACENLVRRMHKGNSEA